MKSFIESRDRKQQILLSEHQDGCITDICRCTVEHPFGTIKSWMGEWAMHFLTRTRARVSTEMSLHVLAYNEANDK